MTGSYVVRGSVFSDRFSQAWILYPATQGMLLITFMVNIGDHPRTIVSDSEMLDLMTRFLAEAVTVFGR